MSVEAVHTHGVETDDDAMPDPLQLFFALSERLHDYRVEFIDRETRVSPPPDGDHETLIWRLARQLARFDVGDRFDAAMNKGVQTPAGDRVVPDITVTASGAMRGAESWMPSDGVLLVVEVTSTAPGRDRFTKRQVYAEAAIPLYLLIDRTESKLTLFTEPEKGNYTGRVEVGFGKLLPMPDPFGFVLDTASIVD
ncbi:Uma2 family endonuclease [Embleya sp. MST-111070]|uniref:Uma2 family endonuclease n=1 Tax=Embleya sp. MST-111070 TaxID=3398231 RepID=UPI003F7348A5